MSAKKKMEREKRSVPLIFLQPLSLLIVGFIECETATSYLTHIKRK